MFEYIPQKNDDGLVIFVEEFEIISSLNCFLNSIYFI